jgi:hypothetical protein
MNMDVKGVTGKPIRVEFEFDDGVKFYNSNGQFIADYNLDTILEVEHGLNLYMSEPDWKVDGRWMSIIKDWLSYHMFRRD